MILLLCKNSQICDISFTNKTILELANLPTIKNRIKTLAKRWLKKCETNNNEDVLKFIHCEVNIGLIENLSL